MELSNEDRQFLVKRTRLVRAWPTVGTILLLFVIGLGIWLFWSKPLLANPFLVLARLKNDSVPASTLTLMAGLLPVVFTMCIVLAVSIVLFAFAGFANEKKYLAIIRAVTETAPTLERSEPQQTSVSRQAASGDKAKPRR